MNILHLLTVLFVGLKLTGHIGWSWGLVLSPTLIPLGLAAVCYGVAGVAWLSMSKEERSLYRAKKALENYAEALRRQ